MKQKIGKVLIYLGLFFILISALVLAVRSHTIDVFTNIKHKSYLPPVGKMIDSQVTEFVFAAAGDTGGKNEPIERVIKDIRKNTKAKFILHLGDLVRYRNPSHFDWIAEEMDAKLKKLPMYLVPGNHEIEAEDGEMDKHLYTEKFGQLYYWFGYGNTLFVGLDSSEEKIDAEQFEWLKVVLQKFRPDFENCVIYMHVPPISPHGENKKKLDEQSEKMLAQIIKGHNISLILAGHVHYFSRSRFEDVPLITVPVSGQESRVDNPKFGYVLVEVDGKTIAAEEKYVKTEGETDYFEIFMSSAMVKDSVKYGALVCVLLGAILLICGKGLLKQKN